MAAPRGAEALTPRSNKPHCFEASRQVTNVILLRHITTYYDYYMECAHL